MNSILRDTFDGLIMFESLCVSFSHFLDSIFLIHIRKYFNNEIQNDSDNYYCSTNDKYIKLSIITNRFIILALINESIAWSLIILFANLLISPVSFFYILDKSGNSFSKSLSNFTNSCPCTTTCSVPFTTGNKDK